MRCSTILIAIFVLATCAFELSRAKSTEIETEESSVVKSEKSLKSPEIRENDEKIRKKRKLKRKRGRKLRKIPRQNRKSESSETTTSHGQAHIEQISSDFGSNYLDQLEMSDEEFLAHLQKMSSDLSDLQDQLSLPSEHELAGLEVRVETPETVTASYEVIERSDEAYEEYEIIEDEDENDQQEEDRSSSTIEYHPAILNYGIASLKGKVGLNELFKASTEKSTYETVSPAPFETLPHRYTAEPTSLEALNTYVPPNEDKSNENNKESERKSKEKVDDQTSEENRIDIDTEKPQSRSKLENLPRPQRQIDSRENTSESDFKPSASFDDPVTSGKRSPKVNNYYYDPSVFTNEIKVKLEHGKDFRPSKLIPEKYEKPEFQQNSSPYSNSFGVSVDFAGFNTDNPLYSGHRGQPPLRSPVTSSLAYTPTTSEATFKRDIVPDHLLGNSVLYHPYPPNPVTEGVYYYKDLNKGQSYIKDLKPDHSAYDPYLDTDHPPPPAAPEGPHGPLLHSYPSGNILVPPPATSTKDPALPTSTTSSTNFKLPQLPKEHSLFLLAPSGPRVPVFNKLTSDIDHFMKGFVGPAGTNANVGVNQNRNHQTAPQPNRPFSFFAPSEESMTSRISNMVNKLMGNHYGDRTFDGYDFVPLIAVLVAAGLLITGLFPNGITGSLGLINGNLTIGKAGRKVDEDATPLENALDQLESGILLVSALRHGDGCAEKLACRLGDLAKEKFSDSSVMLGAVRMILPEQFDNFSRSFDDVINDVDRSSCAAECARCVTL